MFMDEIDDAKILCRADLSTLEKEDEFRTVRPAVRVVYSKQNDNNEKYHVIKETFTDAKSFTYFTISYKRNITAFSIVCS